MADRGKRVPLEKRIKITGKIARAVFAATAVMAAVFWQPDSGRAMAAQVTETMAARVPEAMAAQEPEAAEGYGAELRIARKIETAEGGEIQEPSEQYWDGNGNEYRLDYWEIVTIPGQDVSRRLERKMVYAGVEGAEEIPGAIFLKEDVSGNQAEGTLFLRENRIVREQWQDGFTAPVTFHAYGADEYHGGSLVIPGDAVLETCVSMGGQLLEFMGLSPLEYRILFADWSGESYEDEEGRICRQAVVRGQKLLRDYEAAYEGEVRWTKPETYELEMVYRLVPAVSPVSLETAPEAAPEPAAEVPGEGLEGSLWYWVRSGFVITVGAGLIGIGVGLLVLLAMWYGQNRREHRRKCLPRIKG